MLRACGPDPWGWGTTGSSEESVLVGRSTKYKTHSDVYIALLSHLEHDGSCQLKVGRCWGLPTFLTVSPLAAFCPLEQVPLSIHLKFERFFKAA